MEQLSLRGTWGRPKNGPIPIRHYTTTVLVSSAHSVPKFAHVLVGVLFIPQMIGWPQKESHCMCANRPKSCFLIKISGKVHYHAAKYVSKSVLYLWQTWWYKSSLYTRRAIAEWCPQGFAAWPRRSAAPWRQPGICQRHQIIGLALYSNQSRKRQNKSILFWDPRLSQTSLQPILPENIRQLSKGNMAGILQVCIACCILHTAGAISDLNLGILTIWVPLNWSNPNPKSKPTICLENFVFRILVFQWIFVFGWIRIFFFHWIRNPDLFLSLDPNPRF